jgi:hypothetical protein
MTSSIVWEFQSACLSLKQLDGITSPSFRRPAKKTKKPERVKQKVGSLRYSQPLPQTATDNMDV